MCEQSSPLFNTSSDPVNRMNDQLPTTGQQAVAKDAEAQGFEPPHRIEFKTLVQGSLEDADTREAHDAQLAAAVTADRGSR